MKTYIMTEMALLIPLLAAALALSSCAGNKGIVKPVTQTGTLYVEGARARAGADIATMEPSEGAVVQPITIVARGY